MSKRRAEPTPCDDCGVIIVKRRRVDRPTLCHDHALERVSASAREMHAKSGPAWDAWLSSNATKPADGG